MQAIAPHLMTYEDGLRSDGYRTVVGLDEVGRGALAGPIVAAAVVLPDSVSLAAPPWNEVCDSKIITSQKRTELALQIKQQARAWTVAEVAAPTIDAIGIGPANRQAMEFALDQIEMVASPDFLLLDAVTIDCSHPQIGVIDGDALCLSIAAASIVAKVHRDTIMADLALRWPAYQWERNKGYGVPRHLEALRAVGPCPQHRLSFRPVREAQIASNV